MKRITKIMKLFALAIVITVTMATVFSVSAKAKASIKLDAVTGLRQDVSESSDELIKVEWSAVYAGSDYDIYYLVELSEDNVKWSTVDNSTYMCSYDIDNLQPGKSYFVRVIPFYEDNDNNPNYGSPALVKVCTAPSIEGMTAKQINATSNSVTFSWTKVDGATEYAIYDKDNKPVASKIKGLQYTVTGLQQNSDYYYKIYPVRSEGATSVICSNIDVSCETVKSGTCFDIKLKQWNWGSNTLQVYAQAKLGYDDYFPNCDGFEYSLFDSKGKLVKKSNSEGLCKLKHKSVTNSVCYVIIRPYCVINNTKCFGTASYKQVFVSQPKVARKKMGKNYKLTWKKVAGAKSYTIYKVNEKSLKKIKTVKKLTYTLKKAKKGKYIVKADKVKYANKKYTTTLGEDYKFITIE